MSESISFLRHIAFKAPVSFTPVWIKAADLYEDDNRIYAFLTIVNDSEKTLDRCRVRITPFDGDKFGLDPFGIQISNLGIKSKSEKEHPSPLILPKGTFGFNYSFISYAFKKGEDQAMPVSTGETVSGENAPTSSAPVEAPKAKRLVNKVRKIGKTPFWLLPLLALLVFGVCYMILGNHF